MSYAANISIRKFYDTMKITVTITTVIMTTIQSYDHIFLIKPFLQPLLFVILTYGPKSTATEWILIS